MFIVYPLFVQVDLHGFVWLQKHKVTRQTVFTFSWMIYLQDSLIQNDPSLLLKLVVLQCLLFLAQLRLDPSPPTLWDLNSSIRDDRMQRRPAGNGLTPALRHPPALNVKLVRGELKLCLKCPLGLLCSWPSAGPHKLSSNTANMSHPQCLLWNCKPSP